MYLYTGSILCIYIYILNSYKISFKYGYMYYDLNFDLWKIKYKITIQNTVKPA